MAKGSITKRTGKRGVSWLVTYDVGHDPVTGKRQQRRFTCRTRKEAEEELAGRLRDLRMSGYLEPSREPTAAYLARWLESARTTLRPNTAGRYELVVRSYLVPNFGEVPLGKLNAAHIQAALTELANRGLAPGTVGNAYRVLRRALFQAVRWKLIAQNPCNLVDVPRVPRTELHVWNRDQIRAFLEGTSDTPLAALWRLALLTGMRRGELLALHWADVDFAKGSLSVNRTLTRSADDKWIEGEPKTKSSRRRIALPGSCTGMLRSHRTAQLERRLKAGSVWNDTDIVFDRGDGLAIHPAFLRTTFDRETKRLGLPRLRVHDLRHSAATFMLSQGDHPKVVQERLGHANISMTMDLYSHVSMDLQRASADRLDEALGS
jgi:integrase